MTPIPVDPLQTRLEREFKYSSPLMGCRFDPSGRFLFVSAEDNSIQRYDLISRQRTTFAGHQSWLRAMGSIAPPTHLIEQRSCCLSGYLRCSIIGRYRLLCASDGTITCAMTAELFLLRTRLRRENGAQHQPTAVVPSKKQNIL